MWSANAYFQADTGKVVIWLVAFPFWAMGYQISVHEGSLSLPQLGYIIKSRFPSILALLSEVLSL